MRIFIFIFVFVSLCFAWPNGTEYAVPITARNTYMTTTSNNFVFVIDLSSKLASDASFKSRITNTTNISVFDSVENVTKPKTVKLDLTNNKLVIYFDAATSSVSDKRYYVCVGSGVSQINSTSSFTNSDAIIHLSLNEFSDQSTTYNDATGNTATVNATANLGVAGVLGNGVETPTNGLVATENVLGSATAFTLSSWIKYSVPAAANLQGVLWKTDFINLYAAIGTTKLYLYFNGFHNIINYDATSNQWIHFVFVYNGNGSTNSDKVKIYINGVEKSVSFTGAMPASLPSGSAPITLGRSGSFTPFANYDELLVTSTVKSQGWIQTYYNQISVPSSFWAIGDGFITLPVTPNPHTDTIKFVCSGTGITSYQWYVDSLVSGATDSAFTVYADSAFYARKPTVSCWVSNGVDTFVGFEWTFTGNTTSISRWRAFRSTTKWDAFKGIYK